jgi:2-oxoglutarate/2-oxoacid ferredoxin oxidoreductase subunit alpha
MKKKKAPDNREKILMVGNEVIGEAAIRAGCKFYAGYPITPQNELTVHMSKRMVQEGRPFIQAESELAAINMVFGASCIGERAMTSSSSPGISLKQEGISYLAGCRLPAVIINMSRGGPGLGNIAPAQSDYFQATRGGGHGDYRTIVLAPNSVQELYDLTYLAFDLADEYRTPVIVLGDGALGQMAEPVRLEPSIKYKLTEKKKDWALDGGKTKKHKIIRSLFLGKGALENHNKALDRVYDKIKKKETRYKSHNLEDSRLILVAFGTASRACLKAMQDLRARGKKIGLIRPITLWPFPQEVINQTASKKVKFLVVEMNMGQMVEDVKLATEGKAEVHFYGRTGGEIPSEKEIKDKIETLL